MTKPDETLQTQFEFHQGAELIMRLGIGMTMYFPRPFESIREGVLASWRQIVKTVGPDTFTWARLGGGNKSRAMNPAAHKTIEAWLGGQKDYGPTCWISVHDGPFEALGEHSFVLTGPGVARSDSDTESGFFDFVLPVRLLNDWGSDKVAQVFNSIASHLPDFYCGVAGFVFHRSPFKFNATIERMGALSKRFGGVEISASEELAFVAPRGITTVNWLTYVGKEHLKRLGGPVRLKERLGPDFHAANLPGGLVIRAGQDPVLGDQNRPSDELRPLRRLYTVLEPAQAIASGFAFHGVRFDADRTTEWLTRLAS